MNLPRLESRLQPVGAWCRLKSGPPAGGDGGSGEQIASVGGSRNFSHLRTAPHLWTILLYFALAPPAAVPAEIVATDNADNPPYPASNLQPGDNGGAGFTGWRVLESGSPGARFVTQGMDGGRYSWALSGTYELGRGLVTPLSNGTWRVLAVHDPDNRAFSGFSLKVSTQPGLAAGELLRFGIQPGTASSQAGGVQVSTNRGASWASLDCGWSASLGAVIEYTVTWESTGYWWLSVRNLDEGTTARFVGARLSGEVAGLGVASQGATLAEGLSFDAFVVEAESAAPRLRIAHTSAGMVAVSWPAPAPGWHLQENDRLTATNWTEVAHSPQPVAGGWQVTLPTSPGAAGFYRLAR